MMNKEIYYRLLKDDRWLDKREEILQRDDYKCFSCNHKADDLPPLGNQLHVHHLIYKKDLNPWEYDNKDLITLCDECHKFITIKIQSCTEIIRRMSIDDDIAEQLEYFLKVISEVKNPWRIREYAHKYINYGEEIH